jgi:hypothetical protein
MDDIQMSAPTACLVTPAEQPVSRKWNDDRASAVTCNPMVEKKRMQILTSDDRK